MLLMNTNVPVCIVFRWIWNKKTDICLLPPAWPVIPLNPKLQLLEPPLHASRMLNEWTTDGSDWTIITHKYYLTVKVKVVKIFVIWLQYLWLQRHCSCVQIQNVIADHPLPSARQHQSYGDCLEVKREYYQNCSMLDCVTQCSQSTAHLYEHFLQVK